ncbi:F-box/WD repeat-containing protein 1A [Naviculisporaceae sp. PSN 640]
MRTQHRSMADFNSQTDEGYSEDPLSGPSTLPKSPAGAVTALGQSRPSFPAWLIQHISGMSTADKTDLTMAILSDLPTSAVIQIVNQLTPRLAIDFVHRLPPEICLKILGYLDPVSLVNVARCCKEWRELALDRKLWEHLYYGEGWRAKPQEIKAWELKVNGESMSVSSPYSLPRTQSNDDGPPHKKRVLSASSANGDSDMIMLDADGALRQEPADMEMTGISLFGDGVSRSASTRTTGISQRLGDLDMRGSSSSSAKGKGIDKGKGRASTPGSTVTQSSEKGTTSSGLTKSTLWVLDEASGRYRINWNYLYTMRRRLESNWELGKFTNFQFPHPDHPEEGHGECIYTLQYNSDYLVSGSRDKTIKIWDMHTRRCIRTLAGHTGSVLCLQFDSDPEEDIIVSGSSDTNVIIWRFSTGEVLKKLETAHQESVLNVKFDNRILVTSSKDKTIKVFNRRTLRYGDVGYPDVEPVSLYGGQISSNPDDYPSLKPWSQIACLEGHGAAVNTVQIHDNEIVSASGDRHIKIWDWVNKACIRTIVGHMKGIACVLYDGRRIVSGSSDSYVKVFDRVTGLEVACLRSHQELVRTVQAGFADLAYSKEEDEAEARRVDTEWVKAVASGLIEEPVRGSRRPQRVRPNAGSRRPEDICATGAKLPPGGGGGKYGRIVSGSYDASIIIWRKDKEGVWRDQHRLKQADAALAAMGQARAPVAIFPVRQPNQPPGAHGGLPTGAHASLATAPSIIQPPVNPMVAALNPQGESSSSDRAAPTTLDDLRQIIEQAVQGGQQAFGRALAMHPQILSQRHYVETVIDSQFSPVVRSQLRQAFSAALIRAQFEQARSRREAMRAQENRAASGVVSAGGSSSTQARPGTNETAGATTRPTPAAAALVPPTQTITAQMAAALAAHQAHAQPPHAPAGVRVHQVLPPVAPDGSASALPQVQGPPPVVSAPADIGQPPTFDHHTNAPRMFKLQFDAHQIIACSQSSVIVGWDFCNGDPELEEASRFFDTVQ